MVATPTSNLSFQNFFSGTLSSDITSTSTDIPMDNIPNGSEGFLVIDPDSTTGREVIYYNSKTATKVVCPSVGDGRGQDDTTAGSHLQGTTVIMAPVAAFYEALLSLFLTSPQGWSSTGTGVSSVTHNGNRSYTLVTSSDVSSLVSPGMRLKSTRTVASPTQCTTLNGTTQYWNKTSPAGMTFTDDFAAGAWIYLTSYATAVIQSRYNGTSGWDMGLNSNGQVYLQGFNGGVGNLSYVLSAQSVPLNRWVHVAGQLDMSAFTATTTTSYIMIDGVNVPASVTRSGTNPTALIQAGNYEVGSRNGGTSPFPGKIAQVWVSSAKVTQANVQSLMNEGLTSSVISTNNIISAYSFDGVATDLNTGNANNLTSNGSVAATTADSPFGYQSGGTISSTVDYGIVTGISGTTVNVQVPAGNTLPTVGGISSLSYSTYSKPYGFPSDPAKWTVEVTNSNDRTTTGNTSWNSLTDTIVLPIGSWSVRFKSPMEVASPAATATYRGLATLSSDASTETNPQTTISASVKPSSAAVSASGNIGFSESTVTTTSSTTFTVMGKVTTSTATLALYGSTTSPILIRAVCAYL